MPYPTHITAMRLLILSLVLFIAGCELDPKMLSLTKEAAPETDNTVAELSLAVSNRAVDLPWLLAQDENRLDFSANHRVRLRIEQDDYRVNLNRFMAREIDAISINSVDAIAQIVRQDIEADVILIAAYSNGNEAILVPNTATHSLNGKRIALTPHSSRHYLLERYLVRRQIDFDSVEILDVPENNITDVFGTEQAYAVVTENPNLSRLLQQGQAVALFDSRQIPNEIVDLIVVHREVLIDNPGFSQALLAIWFPTMERLQGTRRASTLEAMARIANMSREEFDRQIATISFSMTPAAALSAIRRDRIIRKTMRHIRYFVERNDLMGEEEFTNWVSYPGRTPALLHFNADPLQHYIAPVRKHQGT
ncbi:ABC transporter substrate-binding protein [Thioflexithrix psekupsensis]|nr:ABC transporter substrate-binding protein [Thioflexithrix psekupsensis]